MFCTPAQIKPQLSEWRWNSLLLFLPGVDVSHVNMCASALTQSYQYPNLLEGADCVGRQLHRDKECPFSGITKFLERRCVTVSVSVSDCTMVSFSFSPPPLPTPPTSPDVFPSLLIVILTNLVPAVCRTTRLSVI